MDSCSITSKQTNCLYEDSISVSLCYLIVQRKVLKLSDYHVYTSNYHLFYYLKKKYILRRKYLASMFCLIRTVNSDCFPEYD
jgi:hypothetical protein